MLLNYILCTEEKKNGRDNNITVFGRYDVAREMVLFRLQCTQVLQENRSDAISPPRFPTPHQPTPKNRSHVTETYARGV